MTKGGNSVVVLVVVVTTVVCTAGTRERLQKESFGVMAEVPVFLFPLVFGLMATVPAAVGPERWRGWFDLDAVDGNTWLLG